MGQIRKEGARMKSLSPERDLRIPRPLVNPRPCAFLSAVFAHPGTIALEVPSWLGWFQMSVGPEARYQAAATEKCSSKNRKTKLRNIDVGSHSFSVTGFLLCVGTGPLGE